MHLTQLKHAPETSDLRGGATTADHIDILGSSGLNEVVLKVAAGRGDEIGISFLLLLLSLGDTDPLASAEDHYVSNIRDYVKKMQWD